MADLLPIEIEMDGFTIMVRVVSVVPCTFKLVARLKCNTVPKCGRFLFLESLIALQCVLYN